MAGLVILVSGKGRTGLRPADSGAWGLEDLQAHVELGQDAQPGGRGGAAEDLQATGGWQGLMKEHQGLRQLKLAASSGLPLPS
jgi:hypothetical protein